MIKVYGTMTCPNCKVIEDSINKRSDMEYIDICSDIKTLKEFIRLRDNSPVFDEMKKEGKVGVPCFLFEDGRISLDPKDAGIKENSEYCSVEDHKNGRKGC